MAAPRWNPARYDQYAGERSAPFFDLTSRIHVDAPRRVVDLGCGPGSLTRSLAERWPEADVVGIDSSAEMLDSARTQEGLPANLTFEHGDIRDWRPGQDDDVVVTNAALQWVPEHPTLLASWFADLPTGAAFALQVPGNFDSPSHTLLRDLARSERWQDALGGLFLRDENAVLTSSGYLGLALDAGLTATAWSTEYQHLLQGENAVLDWSRGTRLLPVLGVLSDEDATAFESEYASLLRAAYPVGPHGTVYPFLRHFLVAVR